MPDPMPAMRRGDEEGEAFKFNGVDVPPLVVVGNFRRRQEVG